MSTTYYLNKQPIGIRTLEGERVFTKSPIGVTTWKKQRVFRWIMHPIAFIRRVMDMSQACEITDEYGNTVHTIAWMEMMQEIDISIYNRDEAQSLE